MSALNVGASILKLSINKSIDKTAFLSRLLQHACFTGPCFHRLRDLLCSNDSGGYSSYLHCVLTLFLTTNRLKQSYEMQFTIAHN